MGTVFQGIAALIVLGTTLAVAQQVAAADTARPLPDIAMLMHEVEAHQRASEAIQREYIYHSALMQQALDGHGGVKKTETEESEIFYVAGARIRRITKKDGKDLSPDEQKKQTKEIDKEIAKAKQRQGKPEDERDVVTVSRFLELGSFSNARRVVLNGRDTIAVDFAGDPKAKTHSQFEGAIREMAGTVWVDEQDRALRKLQGSFVNAFKIGGGLLADVKKGSSFGAEWTKVNGEVWLPATAEGRGSIRVLLLLSVNGSAKVVDSDYRKFKATSTILPGVSTVEQAPQ